MSIPQAQHQLQHRYNHTPEPNEQQQKKQQQQQQQWKQVMLLLAHALLYFALLMLISAIMWQLQFCDKNSEKVVPCSKYSEEI